MVLSEIFKVTTLVFVINLNKNRMHDIGIFYGSTGGNTEAVAKQIKMALGTDNVHVFDVAESDAGDLNQFSNIILGTSTWGIGDLQEDFEEFLNELDTATLTGKKVAIFGCGDQVNYPDSFVDGIGIIYETIVDKGSEIVGKISTDGYDYDESRAEINGQFIGLPIDEDNQYNLTTERIEKWVEQLKKQFV